MSHIQINNVIAKARGVKGHVISRENGSGDYLALYLRSEAFFQLQGQKQTVQPGTFILYTPGEPQQFYTSPEVVLVNDFLHFQWDEIDSFLQEIEFPVNQLIEAPDMGILEIFMEIQNAFYSQIPHYQLLVENYLQILLLKVLSFRKNGKSMQSISLITALREDLLNGFTEDIKIEDLAKKYGLSQTELYEQYKRLFGISPKQELLKKRLSYSKFLLSNTDFSVKQTAWNSGFHNEYHFIRCFRKHFGITPLQYKRRKGIFE